MKKISLLVTLMVIVLAGCRNDNSADTEELLGSVPSSATMVAVADLQSILEKAGCKVSDGKVEASEEFRKAIASSKSDFAELTRLFVDGESGVDPSVSVVFADGAVLYNCGIISDTSRFKAAVEKSTGSGFTTHEGIEINGKVAMMDNRYWMVISGRSAIDPAEIRRYTSLSDRQSFNSSQFAVGLRDSKMDIRGWGDISGMLNVADVDFQQRAMVKMALEMFYADGEFASFGMDIRKGESEVSLKVLDAKGKPAKFQYRMEKLDKGVIDRLGGNAAGLVALSLPSRLIEQLQKQTSGQPSMLGVYLQALSAVDGTVAVALAPKGNGFSGVISTTGGSVTDLSEFLRHLGATTKMEGKTLAFSRGEVDGPQTVADLALRLKGAAAGVVYCPDGPEMKDAESVSFLLVPEDGTLALKVLATARDKDSYILQTALGVAGK